MKTILLIFLLLSFALPVFGQSGYGEQVIITKTDRETLKFGILEGIILIVILLLPTLPALSAGKKAVRAAARTRSPRRRRRFLAPAYCIFP